MKISELVEGKKYTRPKDNGFFKIANGELLYRVPYDVWRNSDLTYNEVLDLDFTEVIQYVGIMDTLKHDGLLQFDNVLFCKWDEDGLLVENGYPYAVYKEMLTEKKWRLL